ncbi:MAG: hypothetical protein ACRCYS_15425, partial [Beijerinckiaceae bacterium]
MLTAQRIRAACALLIALCAAIVLKVVLVDPWSDASELPASARLAISSSMMLTSGLVLALLGAVASEALRIRSFGAHVLAGIAAALVVAWLATWGAPLTSPVYADAGL